MSVEFLKLDCVLGTSTIDCSYNKDKKEFELEVYDGDSSSYFWFDRDQASLLKLWLEEKLK